MNSDHVMDEIVQFRDERGWNKFHTLINLARALNIESSEVEKIFQWKSSDADLTDTDREDLKMEVADVLIYAYYMCAQLGVKPEDIIEAKMAKNQKRHWKFEEQ